MVSGFYATDATILPSGATMIQGIDSIREFWRSAPDHGLVSLTIETETTEVSGDIGFEVGRFNRTLRPRHGALFQESGKFLVIYRRQEERVWRAVAEMFNTNSR
jgi:ketosteroid isomerase-like protein